MATRFVLPSGAAVTRAWNGDGFRFELCGDPVQLLPDDIRALAALVDLRELRDVETFEQQQEPLLTYEKADPTEEPTKP